MGWRISFYLITKKKCDKLKNLTEQDYLTKRYKLSDSLYKYLIWYDTMTDLISEDKEEKFSSRLFPFPTDDNYFGEISKEQLKNLILASRLKVINYLKSCNANDYIRYALYDWEGHFAGNDKKKEWFANLDFNENKPFLICHGHTYEHAIYDMLHMYKSINWETHSLICIGG